MSLFQKKNILDSLEKSGHIKSCLRVLPIISTVTQFIGQKFSMPVINFTSKLESSLHSLYSAIKTNMVFSAAAIMSEFDH